MKKLLLIIVLLLPLMVNAQEKISVVTLKNGTNLKGVIKSIDPTDAVIIVIAGIETKLKMDSIESIEEIGKNNDGSALMSSGEKMIQKKEKVTSDDPLRDFKGFLLAKGNNVIVTHSNSEGDEFARYDREGAKVIITQLKEDGFWNVVDDMMDAHFIINYDVDTRKSDKAILSISSTRLGISHKLAKKDTSESVDDNKKVAMKFYKSKIKSLQNKIQEGNVSRDILEDFTVR